MRYRIVTTPEDTPLRPTHLVAVALHELLEDGNQLRQHRDHLARGAEAGLRTLDVGGVAHHDALDVEQTQVLLAREDDRARGVEAVLGNGGSRQRVVVEENAADQEERQVLGEGLGNGDGREHEQVGGQTLAQVLLRLTHAAETHVVLGVVDEKTRGVAGESLEEGGVGEPEALEDVDDVEDGVAEDAQVHGVLLLGRRRGTDDLARHHLVQRFYSLCERDEATEERLLVLRQERRDEAEQADRHHDAPVHEDDGGGDGCDGGALGVSGRKRVYRDVLHLVGVQRHALLHHHVHRERPRPSPTLVLALPSLERELRCLRGVL